MKKFIATFIFLKVFVLCPLVVLAWSAPGHMTIAAIAYRELSEDDKGKVSNLLTNHPDYTNWKESYTSKNVSEVDLDTYIFMRASTWPDEIRRRGSPYDHPEWHYVDYPLEPPAFLDKPSPFPTNDILFGISKSEEYLGDTNASLENRAVYLSWLIHLIGDIHQPLHCSTLVNSNYPAPIGDKGGNDFYVRPVTAAVNLHSVWDKALGSSVNLRTEFNYAATIRAEYLREKMPELFADQTALSWSKESRELAIKNVYLDGKLQGSTSKETAPALPDGYTRSLKEIAEKQAALAGYRLANDIKQHIH